MTSTRQVLFIQGGGAGAHDQWDDKLVESLRRELGGGYEVRYPRMPDEGDPSYARWSAAIRREMAGLDGGAVVAGHSVARQSSSTHLPSSRRREDSGRSC
jgi:predicted alpha/beta hydrolase family esterase